MECQIRLRDDVPSACNVHTSTNHVEWIESDDEISVVKLPPALIEFLDQKDGYNHVGDNEHKTAPSIDDILMEHQQTARDFALHRKSCLLALGLGLGKTLIAISIMARLPGPALCVVPAALKSNWESEYAKFSPMTKVIVVKSSKHFAKINICEYDVIIVSYALLHNTLEIVKSVDWGVMVADEAHYLKSTQSLRSKAVLKFSKKIPRLVLMTGTPAQAHMDMYNLLRLMDRKLFKHFHHQQTSLLRGKPSLKKFYFAERYTKPAVVYISGGRKQIVFKQNARHEELQAIISPFTLSMRTSDILTLPKMTRECVTVAKLHKRAASKFNTEMKRVETLREESGSKAADAVLMALLRSTMRAKIKAVNLYLDMVLKVFPGKFIIFAYHRELQDAIAQTLVKKGVKHIQIHGDTPMKQRAGLRESLQHDPQIRVGVLSLGACSTGLNLQFVQLAIFAELIFNSIIHTQAEGRIFRKGQTQPTCQRYLILEGSTDAMVWRNINRKVKCGNLLLNNESTELEAVETVFSDHQVPFVLESRKRKYPEIS